jgi:hypothetical protein
VGRVLIDEIKPFRALDQQVGSVKAARWGSSSPVSAEAESHPGIGSGRVRRRGKERKNRVTARPGLVFPEHSFLQAREGLKRPVGSGIRLGGFGAGRCGAPSTRDMICTASRWTSPGSRKRTSAWPDAR